MAGRGDGVFELPPGSGHYAFALRLEVTPHEHETLLRKTGEVVVRRVNTRQLLRRGFARKRDATATRNHVRVLVAEGRQHGDRAERRVGDMIFAHRMDPALPDGGLPSLAEVRRRLDAGVDPRHRTVTLGEYLDEWLAGRRKIRPNTRKMLESHVRTYWKPHLGQVLLDELVKRDVDEVLNWIARRNEVIAAAVATGEPIPPDDLDRRRVPRVVNPASQREILACLRTALNHAVRVRKLLPSNPCDGVELPEADDRPKPWWPPETVRRFLDATRADPLHAAYRLMLLNGPRPSEVLGLRWSELDERSGTLVIDDQLAYFAGGRTADAPTKTRKSRRVLVLDPRTVEVLVQLRTEQRRARLRAGEAWRGAADPAEDRMFTRADGSTVPQHQLRSHLARLVKRLGLPPLDCRGMRRTASTNARKSGMDPQTRAAMLGHASAQLTEDVYTMTDPEVQRVAAERLAALVAG